MGQNMTRWHRNSPLAARKGWVAPEDAILQREAEGVHFCIDKLKLFIPFVHGAALSCSQQPFGHASGQQKTLVEHRQSRNMFQKPVDFVSFFLVMTDSGRS